VQQAAAWALTEPPALREHVAAARALHEHVTCGVAAALEVPLPQAAFYGIPNFPDFAVSRPARNSPDTCYENTESRLSATRALLHLRLTTSLLYGADEEQRWTALRHPEPSTLPWIARHLDRLRDLFRP
jgi:aspartate aminotransferase